MTPQVPTLPKYDSYKDSGVQWLGQIPKGWEVAKLKYLLKLQNIKIKASESTLNYLGMESIDSCEGTKNNIKSQADGLSNFFQAKHILFGKLRPYLAKVYLAECDGICSTEFLVYEVQDGDENFYSKLMLSNSFINIVDASTYGSKMPRASSDFIGNLKIAIPPQNEQTAIAQFLDKKTAQIDKAIALKTQQISLLKEYKQSTIQKAVTQGLNPAVPMKDSGVAWLGNIPKHWEVKRLKYLGDAIIGLTYSPSDLCDKGDGVLVARSSNLSKGRFRYGVKEDNYVNCKIPNKLILRKGDILICSRNGSRDLIGKCAYVLENDEGNSFGAFTTVFRSKLNDYLFCIFNSNIFKMLSGSFLTSTINQLTIGNLNGIYVPIPPKDEQTAIAQFLDKKTAQIDRAMALQQSLIDKLKAYKNTLINSAVTGKIKVI